MKLLLIDSAVQYQALVNARKEDVDYLVFDASTETYRSLAYKIKEKAAATNTQFTDIAVVQHANIMSAIQFRLLASEPAGNIEEAAPYASFDGFKGFVNYLKTECGLARLDLLGCALYHNVKLQPIIAAIEVETGVDLRASTNFTGNPSEGGDWVMESDNVDIREVYFTDMISEFKGLLYTYNNSSMFGSNKIMKDICGNFRYQHIDICGRPINPPAGLDGYNVKYPSGSVVTWGSQDGVDISGVASQLSSGVVSITATGSAYAALKSDGSVVTWGDSNAGGDSSSVASNLSSGVVAIYSTYGGFAALKSNGSVVTWNTGNSVNSPTTSAGAGENNGLQSDVVSICYNDSTFAALKSDGSVVCWGGINSVPDSIKFTNSDVVAIYSTYNAFAALKSDGSVVTWGSSSAGGDSSTTSAGIGENNGLQSDVVTIYSTYTAFAALKSDGSVVTWGDSNAGANSSAVSSQLASDVVSIYANGSGAFAALKLDGSVVCWGDANSGGISSTTSAGSNLNNGLQSDVAAIYYTTDAFAALKSNGSVVTWGSSGGSLTMQQKIDLSSGVVAIYSTAYAFAALKSNGSVVTWGLGAYGSISSTTSAGSNSNNGLQSDVVSIYSTQGAFAALKSNGSVVTWGSAGAGGSSTTVSSQLTSGVISIYATYSYSFAALKPTNPVAVSTYYYPTGASKIVTPVVPDTRVVVDVSNTNVTVYNNPLNPTTRLSVVASGGSETYTYTWTGATSTTSYVDIPYKSSPPTETITVRVSDTFTTATKTFNVTYEVPEVVNPATSPVPAPGVIQVTADNAIVVSAESGLGRIVSDRVVVSSYTEPAGANIAKLVANITTATTGNYNNITFSIDKYTASNVKVESVITNPATFGTIDFDISVNGGFSIFWKNPVTGESLKTAQFDASNASVNYTGIVLTRLPTVAGRNYFRYVGPNSETIILTYPTSIAPPCFVAGTRIATPTGERSVESLRTGDIVLTADGRKVKATIYSTHIKKTTKENAPYLIPAGAFSTHSPPRDIMLSPKHAIQSRKGVWEIPQFAEGRYPAVQKTKIGEAVSYYHIELPNFFTDNLIANGAVCESLGTKVQSQLAGKALYTFNKKVAGFVRYEPTANKTRAKTA